MFIWWRGWEPSIWSAKKDRMLQNFQCAIEGRRSQFAVSAYIEMPKKLSSCVSKRLNPQLCFPATLLFISYHTQISQTFLIIIINLMTGAKTLWLLFFLILSALSYRLKHCTFMLLWIWLHAWDFWIVLIMNMNFSL